MSWLMRWFNKPVSRARHVANLLGALMMFTGSFVLLSCVLDGRIARGHIAEDCVPGFIVGVTGAVVAWGGYFFDRFKQKVVQ